MKNSLNGTSQWLRILGLTFAAGGLLAQTAAGQITLNFVPVSNAGNAADSTGYGAVGYDYRIGTYEVTLNQYNAFLNAVAATDTYGLYNPSMGTDAKIAGITRSGVSGSYTYSVSGDGNRPVTYVSWYDSARFANWLQNGQPTGLQVGGTTETGAYTLTGNTGLIPRNSGYWMYALPSEDEWYKAAYHQPVGQGGDADNYWLYPTANNAVPNSRNGSVSDANSANFYRFILPADGVNDGYAVSGSTLFPAGNALTAAGAFSLADSFYGTFDQGGSVWEWNNAVIGASRGLRGGSWSSTAASDLGALNRSGSGPGGEIYNIGFRIAIVPEPGAVALLVLGLLGLACQRKCTL